MLKEAVYHQAYGNYAYPIDKDKLFIQFKAKKGDLVAVDVIYDGRFRDWRNQRPRYQVKMERYSSDLLFDYFKAEIEYEKKKFKYFFLLNDGVEEIYYSDYGFSEKVPEHKGCFQYTYICEKDYFDTPDWVKNAVFYQIFPERFCNGNSAINPSEVEDWSELPDRDSFYGGDLQGIINKLDYLERLGIDAIYLTPLFKSPSNHKYDIIDYFQIDPNFGDIDLCKNLVSEAHQRGIRIIFDGVFNHTSNQFFAFQDIIEKGRDSKYADWYYMDSFPVKRKPTLARKVIKKLMIEIAELEDLSYEDFLNNILSKLEIDGDKDKDYIKKLGKYLIENVECKSKLKDFSIYDLWKMAEEDIELSKIIFPNYETFANGIWGMPKLRTANSEVSDYILKVARYWIEEVGIDGWRLDVADEVDHYFWREFRKVVKEANPEAYIVGEVWNDASSWLDGDQFDGVMNYLFTEAVWDFFCKRKIDVVVFEARLSRVRTTYKRPVQLASLNLVDSHDTVRLLNVAQGDKRKQKLVAAFQMTYLGAPMIYYGDEIGITGGEDPDCRRPMIWDKERQDNDLFNWYQRLIAIRKDHSTLRTGKLTVIDQNRDNNIYSFIRSEGNDNLLIVFNNQDEDIDLEFDLKELEMEAGKFRELLFNKELSVRNGILRFHMDSCEVVIIEYLR